MGNYYELLGLSPIYCVVGLFGLIHFQAHESGWFVLDFPSYCASISIVFKSVWSFFGYPDFSGCVRCSNTGNEPCS